MPQRPCFLSTVTFPPNSYSMASIYGPSGYWWALWLPAGAYLLYGQGSVTHGAPEGHFPHPADIPT